eukprot:336881-Amphidinium_carterae.1
MQLISCSRIFRMASRRVNDLWFLDWKEDQQVKENNNAVPPSSANSMRLNPQSGVSRTGWQVVGCGCLGGLMELPSLQEAKGRQVPIRERFDALKHCLLTQSPVP